MSKTLKSVFTALITLTLFALFTPFSANAAVQWDQKGITLRLVNQEITEVNKALEDIKATGANYVTITPGWHTDNLYSSNVDRKDRTPSDELLIYTINKSHTLGLKVFIKPHIDPKTGEWRAKMDPTNKEEFFENYGNMIVYYAKLSQDYKVEQFSIGSELFKLSTNPSNEDYWRQIISEVKAVYSGTLTFNANASASNFDETTLPFWDALDVIGLSMYYPMSDSDNPTQEELLNNWKIVDKNFVESLYNKEKKPIVFTEIGYRSMDGNSQEPGDYKVHANIDLQEQVDLYKALFTYWENKPYLNGIHIWDWNIGDNVGGEKDDDYTPQNKPSLLIIKGNFLNSLVEGSSDVTAEEVVEEVEAIIEQEPPVLDLDEGLEVDEEQPENILSGVEIVEPIKYQVEIADTNNEIYYDRDYTITELPDFLVKEQQILTANNHKYYIFENHLEFEINRDSTIFVAYDERADTLPEWLRDWEKTSDIVKTTDVSFNLYKKEFTKGSINLGGNFQGAAGVKSNYFVFAVNTNSEKLEESQQDASDVQGILDENTEEIDLPEESVELEEPSAEDESVKTPVEDTNNTPLVISDVQIIIDEPESGSILSGEKKIKMHIPNVDRNSYEAYITVDGRRFNLEDSDSHDIKQAKIQFDDWNWNGSGPYNVEVTAVDKQSNILDSESFILFVKH